MNALFLSFFRAKSFLKKNMRNQANYFSNMKKIYGFMLNYNFTVCIRLWYLHKFSVVLFNFALIIKPYKTVEEECDAGTAF